MAYYLLQVSSRSVPGREADYDQWYGDVHVDEVLGVPGFEACQPYQKLAQDHEASRNLISCSPMANAR